MRHLIVFATLLLILAVPAASFAAVASASFKVGVTVQAPCSIAMKALLNDPRSAMRSPASVCTALAGAPAQTILAPQPIITMAQGSASGLSRLTIEF